MGVYIICMHTYLGHEALVQENVGALEVPMDDLDMYMGKSYLHITSHNHCTKHNIQYIYIHTHIT